MPGPVKGASRSTEPRAYVALRMSAAGIKAVDDLASAWGCQRSVALRALLAAATSDPKTVKRAQALVRI